MAESNSSSGGIGLFEVLALLFIVLKIGKVIDWTWWWVLSPFWIPLSIVLVVIIVVIVKNFTERW